MADETNLVKKPEKEKKSGRAAKYLRDMKSEFNKVVWPSKEDTIKKTSVVLGVLVAVSIAVGILDFAFNHFILLLGDIF